MLSPGTMVGPYRVVEHVGAEGTMAEVYRAVAGDGRTVAVKLLGAPDERAKVEAVAVSSLHHPGIVATYDIFEQDGRLCLIQEWIEGQSLETILAPDRQLGVEETVRLGQDVASALMYAHHRNILHRDLKPSNVLRTATGDFKLVDFGAAGLLDPGTELTQAGEFAGTPLYMSPEQAFGLPQSAASDIYGLGLLLYRCLYGTIPGEDSGDFIELLSSRTQTPIVVPPSPLRGLLERCLAIDPAQRPRSAQEVLDALRWLDQPEYQQPEYQPPAYELRPPSQHFPQQGSPTPFPGQFEPVRPGTWRAERAPTRSAGVVVALRAVIAAGAAVLLVLLWLIAPGATDAGFWVRIGVGLVVIGAALLTAWWVRRLVSRSPETERQAVGIIAGAGGREGLTRSMVLEVDQVVARLKGLDSKFLGLTMVMLIREAEEAKESADRVAALVQLVALMEKLTKKLSPWYVRHKEGIATGIAIVGSLVGVASVVSGFLR